MPLTPNDVHYLYGIPWQVLVDGYEKGINNSGPWRKVKLLCNWDDSDNLCDALMGVGQYAAVGPTWVARNPARYPLNPLIFCMDVSAIPIGPCKPDPRLLSGDMCALSVSFGVPELSVDGASQASFTEGYSIPWSKVSVQTGIEQYSAKDTLVGGVLKQGVKVVLPVQTITLRRGNIPYFNNYQALVSSYVGTINASTFMGYPAGTLKFETFGVDYGDRDPSGYLLYEFDLVWRARPINWNYELQPGSLAVWVPATGDADASVKYAASNFLPLLTYGVV